MSLLLSIVTVSAFDHARLKLTLESTQILPKEVEHVFIIPKNDLVSRQLLEESLNHGKHLKFTFDDNAGVYSAMNLGATIASGEYVIFWNSGDLMHSLAEMEYFISEIESFKPLWAVAQGVLENGVIHKNLMPDIWNFQNQKPGSYVSHQVIACKRRTMFDLGLFDLKYKVAADTKMIHSFLRLSTPMVSQTKIVYIEKPQFSAQFHRRSRYETAKLALVDLVLRAHYKPLFNVCKREFYFLKNLSWSKSK